LKRAIEELEGGRVPYRNDDGLMFNRTYRFIGYNTEPNFTAALNFGDDYIISGTKEYFAIFEEVSVYDNAYPDYYTYGTVTGYSDVNTAYNVEKGVYITGLVKELKGKITIPSKVKIHGKEQIVLGIID
jgi:hypothetical protein